MPAGIYERTEYHRIRISEGSKGLKKSEDHKRKIGLAHLGSKSKKWTGGKKISGGYVFIYQINHPYSTKHYVKQARLVMEKHIGRYLTPVEVVHHINGNSTDDRIVNLKLFPNQSKHMSLHNELRKQ